MIKFARQVKKYRNEKVIYYTDENKFIPFLAPRFQCCVKTKFLIWVF